MTRRYWAIVAGAAIAAVCTSAVPAGAQVAPSLGAAGSFAVVASSTVTNTGSTTVTGDLGLSPGTSVTGFPPGVVVSGAIHAADAFALNAQNAVTTAYNNLAGQACTQDLTGTDLGGLTLTPGVYCFSTSAQLTGTLTLNAGGDANAVFIFKIGSTLTTAAGSSVTVINTGSAATTVCNIFWQVGSSATLGTTTAFKGNVLAQESVTANTGATVAGRLFARTGAVTLAGNTVTPSCLSAAVCPVITVAPTSVPNGKVGVAYTVNLTGSGGTEPYSWALASGTLPPGLVLTSTNQAVLAGTPTTTGVYTFSISVTDQNSCGTAITYVIEVTAAPPVPPVCPVITLSPAALLNGVVGVFHTLTFAASGGTGPYLFGVTEGTLPSGVLLTSDGVISGTPTVAGTSNFRIRVTDSLGCFFEQPYTAVVVTAVPTLPQAFVILLGLGLGWLGYTRLRRSTRVG